MLTYYSKLESDKNLEEMKIYEEIRQNKEFILTTLNNIDMSLRGYLLVENEAFLKTYSDTKVNYTRRMAALDTMLPYIDLDAKAIAPMKNIVNEYFKLMNNAVELHKAGNYEEALQIIKDDYGTTVWEEYVKLSETMDPFFEKKKSLSQKNYQKYLNLSYAFQLATFLIGVPTLIIALIRLKRNKKRRLESYAQLDRNNRTLIFNSNSTIDLKNEKMVVSEIITNLTKTSDFIKEISNGNFEIDWEGINDDNFDLNKNTIAGELLLMRNKMKANHEETEKKKWSTDGLNKLTEIIRDHQTDFSSLNEKVIAFIVEFLNVQQAALFVVNEDFSGKRNLELDTCFAYDRKKFLKKTVEIGEGLIGQAYLDGEPVFLSKMPDTYVNITTGQGDPNPKCFVIYPFKHNMEVVAILEITSFNKLDEFALRFLEVASKTIAATQISIKTNIKTKELLEMSQMQEEEMKAKEEEMRQNMEELEATQEEMKRKEIELRKLLNESDSK